MKWLAACGVVWIHASGNYSGHLQWAALGRFGVPFFAMAALYFTTRAASRVDAEPWASYARKRFVRLYIPFLVWNLLYTGVRMLKNYVLEIPSETVIFSGPGWFLGSAAVQLWFLPFLLICNVTLYPLLRQVPRAGGARSILSIALVVVAGLCAAGPRAWPGTGDLSFDCFVAFSYDALPAALVGCAWGLIDPRPQPSAASCAGFLLALITLSIAMGTVERSFVLETGAGVLAVGACLFAPSFRAVDRFAKLSVHAMGVYLVHPLALDALRVGGRATGIHWSGLLGIIGLFALGTGLSLLGCWVLTQNDIGKRIARRLAM